jgi:hypothetical protein
MPASRTDPSHPWIGWTVRSMEKSLGKRVQVIPNSSGGLPGDVFVDYLGVPLARLQWLQTTRTGRAFACGPGTRGNHGLRRHLVGFGRTRNSIGLMAFLSSSAHRKICNPIQYRAHGHR